MPSEKSIAELLAEATEAAQGRRLELAATALEEVLEREPSNLRALDLFGFVRYFQARYAQGEGYCRRALEIEPGRAYAMKGLGLNLARQGKLEEGVTFLEKAIAARPNWFDPYWDLAVVLSEAGRRAEAQSVLARGAKAVPQAAPRFEAFANKLGRTENNS